MTDTLYCTVDTSRVASEDVDKVSAGAIRTNVEKEMRDITEQINWRCRAVTLDRKNPNRVRIACRDEAEHKEVKRVIESNLVEGVRVLRDDLYPIRVDSINRVAVLDETGNIRTGAAEAFGQENDTQVAKVAWLSNREVAKAYGSMVVYSTRLRTHDASFRRASSTQEGNQATPSHLNEESAQSNALTARK